ncbi:hypothetical protein [Amycolatopsis sp. SID8362]|uniref:hypothetical protein n=1 Tax=Amycolatopsis sp. SID8362 TaxID=2690346 RepID=UPI0013688796|nr:hypothetical protein [Amycolatopsis sp. SID8362]NBH01954.1 hypothetical protein [Amycolatopsis sp. SID8362]NED38657.1 hypothetical protein [Amycolatopsis sp. SID8362]
MRTAEVAEMLGATEVTAMKGLTALVEHGLAVRSVTWRGSRPMSTWRVVAPQTGGDQ